MYRELFVCIDLLRFAENSDELTNLIERVGGGLMTTFGDLGNYVNGFTCSPHEI